MIPKATEAEEYAMPLKAADLCHIMDWLPAGTYIINGLLIAPKSFYHRKRLLSKNTRLVLTSRPARASGGEQAYLYLLHANDKPFEETTKDEIPKTTPGSIHLVRSIGSKGLGQFSSLQFIDAGYGDHPASREELSDVVRDYLEAGYKGEVSIATKVDRFGYGRYRVVEEFAFSHYPHPGNERGKITFSAYSYGKSGKKGDLANFQQPIEAVNVTQEERALMTLKNRFINSIVVDVLGADCGAANLREQLIARGITKKDIQKLVDRAMKARAKQAQLRTERLKR